MKLTLAMLKALIAIAAVCALVGFYWLVMLAVNTLLDDADAGLVGVLFASFVLLTAFFYDYKQDARFDGMA